ncbi:MAG: sulfatase [Ardenticatenaceae bacterium]|nr:sulfatase [Ardenticatenaceae bacterium]
MSKPDIVFIVLDTQRADRLGCYGHTRDITPNLDRFAAKGALFTQAISPAQWTIPSHGSLFTGLYPTTHQVLQSSQGLSPDWPHVAEVLTAAGYETIGFCNNPLVGVLNNGFKRGFQTFYNYGGAFPSLPGDSIQLPWPIGPIVAGYTQFLRRISYPIQNFFGRSDLAFRVSLNAWLTPLWSKMANFKGQNERSVGDVVHFLQEREAQKRHKPLFLFLNLMETHLPFWPPGEFVDKVAPYLRQSKEARAVMGRWNREAYRWAAPLERPLSPLESQVLSDMYDAEVAYQDAYLGKLLAWLDGRSRRNTLTIIVADHGDSLGEHNYFGHAFTAYQELIHVPLIVHWPERIQPGRVTTPVSTRRVFHTVLDAVGSRLPEMSHLNPAEVHGLTLLNSIAGRDPEQGLVYSEVYPPLNFVRAIENRQPHLLEKFRCLSLRRAVVRGDDKMKLIQVDGQPDELFDLGHDVLELTDLRAERPFLIPPLNQQINQMAQRAANQREQVATGDTIEMDESLMQQLRGLGYID